MRLTLACLISFIVYLFPIPALHQTQMWGQILFDLINSSLVTYVTVILFFVFALCYQLVIIYSYSKIFALSFQKIVMLSILFFILFYVGLIIGAYVLGFISMQIEGFL